MNAEAGQRAGSCIHAERGDVAAQPVGHIEEAAGLIDCERVRRRAACGKRRSGYRGDGRGRSAARDLEDAYVIIGVARKDVEVLVRVDDPEPALPSCPSGTDSR